MNTKIASQPVRQSAAAPPRSAASRENGILKGLVGSVRHLSGSALATVCLFGELRAFSSATSQLEESDRRVVMAMSRRVLESASGLWLRDLRGEGVVALPTGNGQPSGLRSFAGVPLVLGGVRVGCLAVLEFHGARADPSPLQTLREPAQVICELLEQWREARRAESALVQRDRMIESVPDGLMTVAHNGRVLSVNRAAQNVFGIAADAVADSHLLVDVDNGVRLARGSDSHEVLSQDLTVLLGERRRMLAFHADGGRRVVELKVDPLGADFDDRLLVIVRDVSQLDEARQLLELHALIVEKTESAVLIMNSRQQIQWCNAGFERISGFGLDELVGQDVRELFFDAQAKDDGRETFSRTVDRGEAFNEELNWRGKGGRPFAIALEGHPIFDASGHLSKYVALGFDVTDRKQRAQRKSDFVSMVSHELRTPLTVIAGALDAIAEGVAGPQADFALELVRMGQRNCGRLSTLIEDLLDINQIESGVTRFDCRPIVMATLMRDALASMGQIAQEAGIVLRMGPLVTDAQVQADPRRVTQVLLNLLSNAIKFTDGGRLVELSSERQGEQLRVIVSDQGPGIPNAFKPKMFELFSRDPSVEASGKEGFGLGLCISKGLIEKMGGQIGFDSEEGVGSSFYFDLPLLALESQSTPVLENGSTPA